LDVQERLSLETVASDSLIASEHILRYELAASLCAGKKVLDLGCGTGYGSAILARSAREVVGVDIDEAAIGAARDAFSAVSNVEFAAVDALHALDRGIAGSVDVIVCFEVLEHLAQLDAVVSRLATRAETGTALIFSVPNSRTFEEDNPYHVTDFDYYAFQKLLAAFPEPRIALFQFHAEGSVIVESPDELPRDQIQAEMRLAEHGEPEYANHFLGLVGWDREAVEAARARLRFSVAPTYNRYIRAIELSNRRLWRENARLAARHIGSARSGAASMQATIKELREEVAELQERLAQLRSDLARRQEELQQVQGERDRALALLATPRHRAVETLRKRLAQHGWLLRLVRALWGLVRPPRID